MSDLVLELRFPARASELSRIRAAVKKEAVARGADEQTATDIVTAVDEACQNIIRHAYKGVPGGDIELMVTYDDGALTISLVDWAPPTDPTKVRPRDLDDVRPGGLGTHLIREVMDSVEFLDPPPGCGNLLRMVKRLR
jgi:sigma-B regulation protein RsbU (phosphoserine phosphatase)